jgi:hypothetical protein
VRRSELRRRSPNQAKRKAFTGASAVQRDRVRFAACIVCGQTPVDPAHLCPRSFRGCDEPECVVPLCRAHHREFDDGRLDLLPHVSGQGFEAELAHMQRHYGDPLSVVYRLSGCRWVPEEAA